MQLNPLTAISPIDGRYFDSVKPLTPYFSEFGLMRYRVQVEIEYLIALSGTVNELVDFPVNKLNDIRRIYKNFSEANALEIKEIEIFLQDETYSSINAVKRMVESGKNKNFRKKKENIDSFAAAIILEEFLNENN